MSIFVPILSTLVIVMFGLMITRVAAIALTYTGVSKELARFQARSAYTGTGYTTSETEQIVRHPVRRRIVMLLMLLGNAGLAGMIASVAGFFISATAGGGSIWLPILILALGLFALWRFASSQWVDEQMFKLVGAMLKRFPALDVVDYHGVLHLSEGYTVSELALQEDDWVVGKNLAELRLNDEGIQVLGIHRKNGDFIPTPAGPTNIRFGDTLVLYGLKKHILELGKRKAGEAGDKAHDEACAQHRLFLEQQRQKNEQSEDRPFHATS